ncbi:uncharacterized protein N7459_005803 [Penicillium hispanicum]|uniref:uncharacterized protein n=1 Tax=Penicillium hispanicum TaxID=1080232 RepID=UPI002541DA17|nr:uncharacterized protein N7459_005803 [Penicillium hispanicum]KAJ5579818.1 hypothetical protein N7459_005803 [Penicillium hispanicum]
MAPIKRGWFTAWLDRTLTWMSGLPKESCSYTVDRLQIPMPDGINIAADIYQPQELEPLGTVLVRTPYGLSLPTALVNARPFAARGYVVLLSSCRGTGASEGQFDAARDEAADGQAIVSWMKQQTWYTGAFATIGTSYLGFTQWSLLSDTPADMKAAVINTGPHDFSKFVWGTGAFNSDAIAWADFMSRMNSSIPLPLMLLLPSTPIRPIFDSVPLLKSVDAHFKGTAPTWLREIISHSDLSDPYWEPLQHTTALRRADIPILLTTGWYDLELPDVLEQYYTLESRGVNVALNIGPWTHIGAGGGGTTAGTLAWLDQYLAGKPDRDRPSPVRVFVTGAQEWRNIPRWPPESRPYELMLGPDKKLSTSPPAPEAGESEFEFNPADPTPDTGGPGLFSTSVNPDTSLESRPDVLSFTTEPLDRDVLVCGKPTVSVYHSTSHPYADLLVRISEVDPKGVSRSIAEKFQRLDTKPRGEGVPLHLTLNDCAHRFGRGSKIRLLIAGGSHPRFIRNFGTGDNPATGTSLNPVWHTIRHNAVYKSRINLPLVTSLD